MLISLPLGKKLRRKHCSSMLLNCTEKKWLYQMLAFDAFIGNEDRHENNIDIIVRHYKHVLPPLYDNGGSLLAWATDEELTDTKLRYQFDKAKPFRSRHAMICLWRSVQHTACYQNYFLLLYAHAPQIFLISHESFSYTYDWILVFCEVDLLSFSAAILSSSVGSCCSTGT